MFSNRYNGRNNIAGIGMRRIRKDMGISQRKIAVLLQQNGIDIDKNAVQRMESGERFITDVEVAGLLRTFNISYDKLMELSME